MRVQGCKWRVLSIALLLALCLLTLSLSLQVGQAMPLLQSSPTVTLIPTTVTPASASPSAFSTPSPTLATASYSEMLAVYKEVLETSRDAVASSHKILEHVVRWTTILFGVLTFAGGGALWLIWKTVGEVQAKANELRIQLESTREFNEGLKNLAKEQQNVLTAQSKEAERLSASLAQFERELAGAKRQASLVLSDLKHIVPRLATLADVDAYAMRLFSTNRTNSRTARRTLVELSKDKDPVVRRECVRVFAAMPDYPECFIDLQDPLIVSRLQEMALKDPERGVQLEARLALSKLGVGLRDEQ